MTSEGRRLAVGTGWTLVSTIVAIAIGAVLNPVLVLSLGVGGYGEWAAAIAVASLFGMGGDLGVAGALTKYAAERRGRQESVGSMAGSALVVSLIAGGVAGGVLAWLAPLIARGSPYPEFATLLQIQALQIPVNVGISAIFGLYQGRRLFRVLATFSILQVSASFALTLVLLTAGWGIVGVMLASLTTSVAIFLAVLAVSRRDLKLPGRQDMRADLHRLLPFGLQLTLTNAFSTALYQVDLVVLTFLVQDPQQLGLYALATFVARTLWIFPSSIGTTTYPVVSEYSAASRSARLARYMSTALVASVAITGIMSSGIILFGRPGLEFVFGSPAVPSYELVLLMLPGTAFLGCLRSIASAIPSVGRPDVGLRISLLGAGLLLGLSLVFAAAWQAPGVAVAVAIAFSAIAILLLWSLHRYVLRPQGTRLDARRAARTGVLAVILVALSAAFSLPPRPTLGLFLFAGLISALVATGLIEAAGGRQTWATLMKRSTREAVERG